MATYEQKFRVFNIKHLNSIETALLNLVHSLVRKRHPEVDTNKYLICNQDEDYAYDVWCTIKNGEEEKEIEEVKMRMTKDIVSMVKGKRVNFIHYCDEELWYTTECGYEFPVPISDVGNATFLADDKAELFIRYIRIQIEKNIKKMELLETAKGRH